MYEDSWELNLILNTIWWLNCEGTVKHLNSRFRGTLEKTGNDGERNDLARRFRLDIVS
jgi:hypothetical protein